MCFEVEIDSGFDSLEQSGYIRLMKKANITEAKNHLSSLIDEVKSGTSILILDRNTPVARLEPINDRETVKDDRVVPLVRQGLASAPRRTIDVVQFLARSKAKLAEGVSATQALLAEREVTR